MSRSNSYNPVKPNQILVWTYFHVKLCSYFISPQPTEISTCSSAFCLCKEAKTSSLGLNNVFDLSACTYPLLYPKQQQECFKWFWSNNQTPGILLEMFTAP